MLRTLIEHAGFRELFEASRAGNELKTEVLAEVPLAVAHFALDALFERPVQAEVVELLVLSKSDRRFTSCVLIHGMGGTGKTVTAVATVQEDEIRRHYVHGMYWVTVGADAVGEKIKQLQAILYKQMTGASIDGTEKGKNSSEQEWLGCVLRARAHGLDECKCRW